MGQPRFGNHRRAASPQRQKSLFGRMGSPMRLPHPSRGLCGRVALISSLDFEKDGPAPRVALGAPSLRVLCARVGFHGPKPRSCSGAGPPNLGCPAVRGFRGVGTMLPKPTVLLGRYAGSCIIPSKSPGSISTNTQPSKIAKAGAAGFLVTIGKCKGEPAPYAACFLKTFSPTNSMNPSRI